MTDVQQLPAVPFDPIDETTALEQTIESMVKKHTDATIKAIVPGVVNDAVQSAMSDFMPARIIEERFEQERKRTDSQFDNIKAMFESVAEYIKGLSDQFTGLDNHMSKIQGQLSNWQASIEARDETVKEHTRQLTLVNRDLDVINGNVAVQAGLIKTVQTAVFGDTSIRDGPASIYETLNRVQSSIAVVNQKLDTQFKTIRKDVNHLQAWKAEEDQKEEDRQARRKRWLAFGTKLANHPVRWLLLLAGAGAAGIGGPELIEILFGG